MSNLATLIAGTPGVAGTTRPARRCHLGNTLDGVDKDDRDAILYALHTPVRDGGLSDDALANRLTRGGHPTSNATLSRHRRRLCSCPDDLLDAEVTE